MKRIMAGEHRAEKRQLFRAHFGSRPRNPFRDPVKGGAERVAAEEPHHVVRDFGPQGGI